MATREGTSKRAREGRKDVESKSCKSSASLRHGLHESCTACTSIRVNPKVNDHLPCHSIAPFLTIRRLEPLQLRHRRTVPCKGQKIGMAHAHGTCSSFQALVCYTRGVLNCMTAGECHRHAVTINILPDDIFLEIFAFCIDVTFNDCWSYEGMAKTSTRVPKIAANHICITTSARSPCLLLERKACQESQLLASVSYRPSPSPSW